MPGQTAERRLIVVCPECGANLSEIGVIGVRTEREFGRYSTVLITELSDGINLVTAEDFNSYESETISEHMECPECDSTIALSNNLVEEAPTEEEQSAETAAASQPIQVHVTNESELPPSREEEWTRRMEAIVKCAKCSRVHDRDRESEICPCGNDLRTNQA